MLVSGTGINGIPLKLIKFPNFDEQVAIVLSHPGKTLNPSPLLGVFGTGKENMNVEDAYFLTVLFTPVFAPDVKVKTPRSKKPSPKLALVNTLETVPLVTTPLEVTAALLAWHIESYTEFIQED